VASKRAKVPVVMTIHSFALICPTTFHYYKGAVCEKCCGDREYWCALKNCRDNIFESIAYSIRTAIARKFRLYKDTVTIFIVLAEFAKNRMIDAGFDSDKIMVVPNMVSIPCKINNPTKGNYVAYSGRFSSEKGIETLLSSAKILSNVPFRIAGDGPIYNSLFKNKSDNVEFTGWLDRKKIMLFYSEARMVVIPSNCLEMFPMVVLESMAIGLPIIASRIGGLSEIVDDGITGLLFEPGNEMDLAEKIKILWNDKNLCKKMGVAGREKVIDKYSEESFQQRLISVYDKAIENSKSL
jgi:glycosyltransferase involved in cell wall biosynthesis